MTIDLFTQGHIGHNHWLHRITSSCGFAPPNRGYSARDFLAVTAILDITDLGASHSSLLLLG